jgi:proteasome lid subunit RPN8/RPN11
VNDAVRLSGNAWDAVLHHAAAAWPEECCGLLLGKSDTIVEARPARNIAQDRLRRFQIDPADHFAAIRDARASGRTVVGAYHSHPRGEPRPSPTDFAEAFEDSEFVHVIVRPCVPEADNAESAVAAYRLIAGNFVKVPLVRLA